MTPAELKQARTDAKVSQKTISKRLGINLRLYQKYESGETPIRTIVAIAIRHVLTCPHEGVPA